jgi:hypothetical protein
MITHELAKIYITSDNKRFIDLDKAKEHEEKIQEEKIQEEKIIIKDWYIDLNEL